ncbi:MAG: trigger factor, partial [Ruminococcus sp.]|nr:trigger factor [Ruminococcus sp.]
DQICGHSIGDEFDVNVTFPENYQMEDYAGKDAVFKTKLKAISYEELPEIDDDLVKDATEFETVEEYRADIRTKLEDAAAKQADSAFDNAVLEAIIEKVDSPIPNCMYEQRIDTLISSFDQQLQQQGMNLKLYCQYTGMDVDSLRDTYRDRAVGEVKLRLALEKIAELENIEVSEDEINNSLGEIASANNMDVETVKRFIPMNEYVTDMKVQKAVDLIKENAVVDNSVTEETATEESAE